MDISTLNLDDLYYDYAHPVEQVNHLYGRQNDLETIRQIIRRPQGGLYLVIGGVRSGKTSLLRSVDSLYSQDLKRQRQAQFQGQTQPQVPAVLTCGFSLADELANLAAVESGPGSADDVAGPIRFNRSRLYEMMNEFFTLEELRTLCFDLGVDFDQLAPQGTKASTTRELILRLERDRRIRDLVEGCAKARPAVQWHTVLEEPGKGGFPSSGPALDKWRAGELCERLIRGMREYARDKLDVCRIEWHELDYPAVADTPKRYVEQTLQKVRGACHDKLPTSRLKPVLLMDDADALLQRPWHLEFLAAVQEALSQADLILIMAGGQPLYTAAGQDKAWRNLSQRQIRLSSLNQEAFRALAEEPLGGGHLPEVFLSGVYRQTGGHPYLIKFFLQNVESRAELIASPTPDRLAAAARKLVRQEQELGQLFDEWTAACGETGRLVYRVLVEATGTLSRGDLAQRTAGWIQPGQLDSILDTLCYQGMVTRAVNGMETYSVAGEMYSGWFRENILPTLQLSQVEVARPPAIFAGPAATTTQASSVSIGPIAS
jgi:hypothetical protein